MSRPPRERAPSYQSNRDLGRPERPAQTRATPYSGTYVSSRTPETRATRYDNSHRYGRPSDSGWGGFGGSWGGGYGASINLFGLNIGFGSRGLQFGGGGRGNRSTEGRSYYRADGPDGPGYYTSYGRGRYQEFAGGRDDDYGYGARGRRNQYDYPPLRGRYRDDDDDYYRDEPEWRRGASRRYDYDDRDAPSRDTRRGRGDGGYRPALGWDDNGRPIFQSDVDAQRQERARERAARRRHRDEPVRRPERDERPAPPPVADANGAITVREIQDMIRTGNGIDIAEFQRLLEAKAGNGTPLFLTENLEALKGEVAKGKLTSLARTLAEVTKTRQFEIPLIGADGKLASGEALKPFLAAIDKEQARRKGGVVTPPAPPAIATSPDSGTLTVAQQKQIVEGGVTLDGFKTLLSAKHADGKSKGKAIITDDVLKTLSADIADGKFGDKDAIALVGRKGGSPAEPNGELVKQAQALVAEALKARGLTVPVPAPAKAVTPTFETLNAAINAMDSGQRAAFAKVLEWQMTELRTAEDPIDRQKIKSGVFKDIQAETWPLKIDGKSVNVVIDEAGAKKLRDAYVMAEALIMDNQANGNPLSKEEQIKGFETLIEAIQPIKKSSLQTPAAAAAAQLAKLGVVTADNRPRVQHALTDAPAAAKDLLQFAVAKVDTVDAPNTPAQRLDPNKPRAIEA